MVHGAPAVGISAGMFFTYFRVLLADALYGVIGGDIEFDMQDGAAVLEFD
jgi:hypothetical protein